MQLEGRVALVTGGASGLGLGTARHLIGKGVSVAIVDKNEAKGSAASEDLGSMSRFIACDVADTSSVTAAVDGAVEAFGTIHILVNAAGIAPAQRVLDRDGSPHDLGLFRATIGINLVGMFDMIRQVAKVMAGNEPAPTGERGVIVNVASIAAFEGQVGQAAYSASKGGVVGMTLPLARDLGGIGVRVMTVAPGIMDTPLLDAAPQELKDSLAGLSVFPKRLGTPEDFARLVAAIVENEMLNGEVIRFDAGARMPPR